MNTEWYDDYKKVPDETMSFIRVIAVNAVVKKDYSPEYVCKVFNVSRSSLYEWLNRYYEGGYEALKTRTAKGIEPKITRGIERWLKNTILNQTPVEFGYDTHLWTIDILVELIKIEFDIKVCPATVGNHLRKIGLSNQKPNYKSKAQDKEKVEHFLNDKFKRIQRLADKMGADIGFEDEAGIQLSSHYGKTWGELGKTPEVKITLGKAKFNVLSIVTPQGELRYSIEENNIDSERFIKFLKQVLRGRDTPLILIIDQASFHKSQQVIQFVRENRKKIRIFFFPKHSPELNPDEQVWCDVKDKKIGRQPIKNKSDLKKRIRSILCSLQHSVDRVKSFFKLPDTKYALT